MAWKSVRNRTKNIFTELAKGNPMTTAIHQTTATDSSQDTNVAAAPRMNDDTKVILITVLAGVVLALLLTAVMALVISTASPEQLDQITTMMQGYSATAP